MNSKNDLISYLLSHSEINKYLSQYPGEEWPEVLLNTLLNGIYSLKVHQSQSIPLKALQEQTRKAGALLNADNILPGMKQRLGAMREELQSLEQQMEMRALSEVSYNSQERGRTSLPKEKPILRNVSTPAQKPQESIYPSWWLGLAEMDVKHEKYPQKITQRNPPPLPKPAKAKKVDFWNQTPKEVEKTIPQEAAPWLDVQYKQNQTDKACEAAFEESLRELTPQVTKTQQFNEKETIKQSSKQAWAQDFSDVVKKSPSAYVLRYEESQPQSSKYSSSNDQYTSSKQSSDESKRWGGASSSYARSSMSKYHPSEEMKKFYRNEFNQLLESGSLGSTLGAGSRGFHRGGYSQSSEENHQRHPSFNQESLDYL